jgi:hypothetical protein
MKRRRPLIQPIVDKLGDQLMASAQNKTALAQKQAQISNMVKKSGRQSSKSASTPCLFQVTTLRPKK